MRELLIVGRGGEGVVLASQVLAETFARAGFWVQSFPEFKAERRGAPLSAYVRWDGSPIHRRHKLQACDVLVSLASSPPDAALRSVRPGGLALVNRETRLSLAGPFELARVPATRIARERGILSAEGRPLANAALLGACVRLLLPDGIDLLEEAIRSRLGALAGPNIAAARDGFERCTKQHRRPGDPALGPAPVAETRNLPPFAVSTTDTRANATGTWSTERPAFLDACTACAVCALFCPEGAISRVGDTMVVDLLHCKGCGICEAVCPVRNALELEEVA